MGRPVTAAAIVVPVAVPGGGCSAEKVLVMGKWLNSQAGSSLGIRVSLRTDRAW